MGHTLSGFSKDDTKVCKAIAIILMLYHHLFGIPGRVSESIVYVPLFTIGSHSSAYLIGVFGKICVELFLFLGGYGTYLSVKNADAYKLSNTIFDKLKNLYKQYWQVFLVFIPLCYVMKVPSVPFTLKDFLENFSGILSHSYSGEWWFLAPYIMLMVLYPVIKTISLHFRVFWSELLLVLAVKSFTIGCLHSIPNIEFFSEINNSFFYRLVVDMLYQLPTFWMGILYAKYNLLSSLKQQFSGNLIYCLVSPIVLLLIFIIRHELGQVYDFLSAPIFVLFIVVSLNNNAGRLIRKALIPIGNESTRIWLLHSFYCYKLCPEFVFAPRYTPLIALWLLILSYVSAILLKRLFAYIDAALMTFLPEFKISPID